MWNAKPECFFKSIEPVGPAFEFVVIFVSGFKCVVGAVIYVIVSPVLKHRHEISF